MKIGNWKPTEKGKRKRIRGKGKNVSS